MWMASRDLLVIRPYLANIPFHVSRRVKQLADARLFFLVVQVGQQNRHVRFQRDVIEALFPLFHPFSRSFRRNSKLEFLVTVELFGHLVSHRRVFTSVYRYAAQLFEKQVERKYEPLFFD